MTDKGRARKDELQVIAGLIRRVHPDIVSLVERRRVVEERASLEIGFIFRNRNRDIPVGPRGKVHNSDDAADASVGVFPDEIVHGSRGRGLM